MAVSHVEDLVAFQVAREYKRAVYALLLAHPGVDADRRYASQLRDAASGVEANIAEGFHRRRAGEFRQFLRYAIGSLAEAQVRLRDGVDRQYFSETACEAVLLLGRRTDAICESLHRSLAPFIKSKGRT
jgi:four helix bundle protein